MGDRTTTNCESPCKTFNIKDVPRCRNKCETLSKVQDVFHVMPIYMSANAPDCHTEFTIAQSMRKCAPANANWSNAQSPSA